MDFFDRAEIQPKLIKLILEMQGENADWVKLAVLGGVMTANDIPYKQYGYLKLRPFLDEFKDFLEFYEDCDGRTPVYYVRLVEDYEEQAAASLERAASAPEPEISADEESVPVRVIPERDGAEPSTTPSVPVPVTPPAPQNGPSIGRVSLKQLPSLPGLHSHLLQQQVNFTMLLVRAQLLKW